MNSKMLYEYLDIEIPVLEEDTEDSKASVILEFNVDEDILGNAIEDVLSDPDEDK